LPTVIWCGLIVAANLAVLRPPPMADVSAQVVREQMDQLGPMRRGELMTAIIIASAVVAWAAQPWHRVPPEAIGMVALALHRPAGPVVWRQPLAPLLRHRPRRGGGAFPRCGGFPPHPRFLPPVI